MSNYRDLLSTSTSFLLVDWPDRDVPDTLARHGFSVVSHDGPGPTEYNAYRVVDGSVQVRPVDGPPDRVDIVYAHRPIDELAEIVEQARTLNARAVWVQSGLEERRSQESTRMLAGGGRLGARRGRWLRAPSCEYFDSPYLADAVRELVEL